MYADEGASGKDLERAGVQHLIGDVQAGLLDVVLVWKLDRLSRRQRDVLHLIEDIFTPCGAGFRSATESFDTLSPAGMAMVGMLAVFAQLERATIVERSTIGYRQRLSQGKWAGAAPYGYRYGEGGVLEPDDEHADWVRMIYRQAIAGASLDRIAAALATRGAPPPFGRRRWHASTVSSILHNRAYLGERRTPEGWIKSGHPPLLPEQTWLGAQDAIEARRKGPGRPRRGEASPYLLTGVLFCGACGGRMGGHKSTSGVRYYICDRIKRTGHRCGPGYVRAERLDDAVAAALATAVRAPNPLGAPSRRSESAALDAKVARLVAAVEDGTLPRDVVRQRLEKLRRERERALREPAPLDSTAEGRRAAAAGLARVWIRASHAERREIVQALVERIDVQADGDLLLALRS